MIAAVAFMALVSCSKENIENNGVSGEASDIVFTAEFEQSEGGAAAQTKTELGTTTDGVTAVNWVGNEKVNINGVEFTTKSTGAQATFTTTGSFNENAAKFDAIYPSTAGTALTAVTIPAGQNGTFADAAISVASSTNTSLKFKNLASIIKFQVPSACSTITITSDSDLAGKVSVTFDAQGNPVLGTTVSDASKTITLTGSFAAEKDYYVAVLPGSHKFTVRLDGYLSKASTKAVTTKRAFITNLQVLPALERFSWGLVGQHQSWNISSPTPMYKVDANVYAVLNISLQNTGFKFAKMDGKGNWNNSKTNFGAWKKSSGKEYYEFGTEVAYGFWYGDPIYSNNQSQGNNVGVKDFSKKYDIYVKVYNSWTDSTNDGGGTGIGVKYTIVETGTAVTYPN